MELHKRYIKLLTFDERNGIELASCRKQNNNYVITLHIKRLGNKPLQTQEDNLED